MDNTLDEKQLPIVKPTKSIYLHCSPILIQSIRSLPQYAYDVKPIGIWYSNGRDWRNFVLANYDVKNLVTDNKLNPLPKKKQMWKKYFTEATKRCAYLYRVHVKHVALKQKEKTRTSEEDKKSIVLIEKIDDFRRFMEIYGTEVILRYNTNEYKYRFVKWGHVKNDYGGVELKNVQHILNELLDSNDTFDREIADVIATFDIDSGCAWNNKAIKMNRVRLDEHAATLMQKSPKTRKNSGQHKRRTNRLKALYNYLFKRGIKSSSTGTTTSTRKKRSSKSSAASSVTNVSNSVPKKGT